MISTSKNCQEENKTGWCDGVGGAQRRVRLDRLVREGCSKEMSFEAETRKVGGALIAPL